MPLDPRVSRFLNTLAALEPRNAATLSVPQRRAALEHLMSFSGAAAEVATVKDRTIPGPNGALQIRQYVSAESELQLSPGLVYFHGGGLVAGSLHTHDGICRALANASGCKVLSVDYRLGPEHRFPAAIDDGLAAVRWIAAYASDFGVDVQQLGICGDSAGATLATVVCQQISSERQVQLALQFLLCPITDFATQSPSRLALAQGYLVDEATLDHDLRHYLAAEIDAADPRVSPLRAPDVGCQPPTLIHTAEYDPLRDEGREYARHLERAGVMTRYYCHSGMIHLFYALGALIPYSATAWRLIGTDIRSMLRSPS